MRFLWEFTHTLYVYSLSVIVLIVKIQCWWRYSFGKRCRSESRRVRSSILTVIAIHGDSDQGSDSSSLSAWETESKWI